MNEIKSLEEYSAKIGSGVALAKFSANWCAPCKIIEPILDKLSLEFKSVTFLKIDVDNNPEIAEKYNISSLPTIVVFKDGVKQNDIVGAVPEKRIRESFVELLKDGLSDKIVIQTAVQATKTKSTKTKAAS